MVQEKIFAIAHLADVVVLWVLVLLSVISIGLILERFFAIKRVSNESSRVRARLKLALQSHHLEEVEDMARDPHSLEGRALSYGIRHIKENGSKGLEEAFSSFALVEKPELEKHLNFLATIGSNAPYIGLLGTVLGIMKAFNDLAITPEAGQQTVMAGISIALIATAAGLFVAIPAVISYNYFQRQVKSILQNLEAAKDLCLAYARKKGV
ncbi:MAG: MotA/TolQ/ExbB proton channel family protein [Pseudobdellovibrionaceae bacterium]